MFKNLHVVVVAVAAAAVVVVVVVVVVNINFKDSSLMIKGVCNLVLRMQIKKLSLRKMHLHVNILIYFVPTNL